MRNGVRLNRALVKWQRLRFPRDSGSTLGEQSGWGMSKVVIDSVLRAELVEYCRQTPEFAKNTCFNWISQEPGALPEAAASG